jgi:predicted TPR repeat methyltransferase
VRKPDANRSARDAVQRAIRLHQGGRLDEAAAIYRRVLRSAPNDVDALHFLGVAEHHYGNHAKALELLARAIELAPEHPDLHNNRGNILKRLGRLEEAHASFAEALALRPDNPDALNNMGCVVRERGNLEGAVELFHKAVALRPAHADALHNLGHGLGMLGRLEEAVVVLRSAIAVRPGSATAYRHLGAMLCGLGHFDEARRVYEAWVERHPEDPEARYLLSASAQETVPSRAPDDVVRALFDRFAPSFDGAIARLNYRAPQLAVEAVEAALGPPASGLEVLDAGCGTGLCGESLRAYARRLVGVDLSPAMLDRARARGLYDSLVAVELTQFLNANPRSFDVIVSSDTVVYFGNLTDLMTATAGALKPGGFFVFTAERSSDSDAPDGHRLQPSGRYCHTQRYLMRVSTDASLDVRFIRDAELRMEAGRPVAGWVALLQLDRDPGAPPAGQAGND